MSIQTLAQLKESAKRILQRANVRSGENLAITTDTVTDPSIVNALFDAASEIEANPIAITIPKERHAREQKDSFAEPPRMFAESLKNADVVIPLVRFSSYTKAYHEILQRTRVLGFALRPTVEQAIDWILNVDYEKSDRMSDALTDLLSTTKEFRITSTAGTNITMKFVGRHIADDPGKVKKIGDENYLPGACVCVAPLEESWEGTVIFDGLLYPPNGLLSTPIKMQVSKGVIKKIEGGDDARKFKQWLDDFHDPNMYSMSHIGIGLNPQFNTFTGLKSLDERIYGIVGTGIGTNDIPVFQGKIRARGHTDGYMKCASVYIDGVPLIENGKFVHQKLTNL